VVGAAALPATVAASCGTLATASGARNWNPPTRWTGDALPNTKVACRKLTGYPRPQVAGLSNEKQLMETLGTRLSRSGPSWRGF